MNFSPISCRFIRVTYACYDAIAFNNELRKVRNLFYNTLIAISKHAETQDAKYLDEVRSYGLARVNKILKGKKVLSGDDAVEIHGFITKRMAMLNENHKQLKPDIDAYYSSHRE